MQLQSQFSANKWMGIGGMLLLLLLIYITQQVDYINWIATHVGSQPIINRDLVFVVNKTLRLTGNDLVCIGLIKLLFTERKYVQVAFFLFCFEILVILPIYLIVKLTIEGDSEISSPFLSQIHRLIINPLLMLLLIVSFYYLKARKLPVAK